MTRRGLLISYAFPPVAAPESWVTAKTMGNVPGWEFDVVSVDPYEAEMAEDDCLKSYVDEKFGRISRVEPPLYLRPLGGRYPCRFFPAACQRPDRLRFYNGRMVSAAGSFDPSSYDAFVSRSQWHSSHLVAAELKGVYPDIPWVASLSDPWADNPYRELAPKEQQFNERAERGVIEGVDAIIFPSARLKDAVMSKYDDEDRSKAHLVHHSYDPGLYRSGDRASSKGRTLRYLGSFYGLRTPEPLFAALSHLMDSDPDAISGLKIELVGSIPEPFLQSDAARRVSDYIVAREAVTYLESLALMQDADALLLVDAPAEESFFLPSKLIDYLGAQRPILGITPPGESADLVKKIDGVLADPDDIPSIATGIKEIMARIDGDGYADSAAVQAAKSGYTVGPVGESLRVVLDGLCDGGY